MKTNIRKLDSLTHNDTAATKLINDNFSALQQGIEDALSRSGKTPNFMDAELDMNEHRIINLGEPVDDSDLATKKYVDDTVATEALARQSADNTLQGNIDAEELARQQADNTLQGNIDAEETRAKAAEKAITDTLDTYGNIVTHNVSEFATAAQGAKADTAVQPSDLATVATTGDYDDLSDKPTIPVVNNATITLTQGGVEKGSFTTNQSSNATIEFDAGGSGGTDFILAKNVALYFEENSSAGYIDLSSYAEADKNYFTVLITAEINTKILSHNTTYNVSNRRLIVTRDTNLDPYLSTYYVTVFLIPVEDSSSTFAGVSNGQYITSANNAYYLKAEAQPLLVSGTNIKTLNSTSLLGSGDISITVPTKTSDLNNDSGFITSSDLSGYATETWVGNQGYAVSSSLATVATTGAYSDLSGTPSLSGYQTTSNLVTSVSSASTDSQYPSAKLLYDTVGDIETLLQGLR